MQRFLPVVAFTLAFIITLAPIPLRNGLIGGDWVPITANAGVTLYMGTNPLAQGGLGRIAGLSNDIEEQRTQSIEIASTEAGRTLSAAEASRHWINKTLAWITENPLDFVTLQMKKTLWGLHHTPPAVNQSVHFEQIHIPLIAPLKYVTAFTLTAGLLGTVFLLRRRSPEDLILLATFVGYLALTWVYYASDRFLVTLLPIMAIQAAMLFDQWHTVSARRRTTLLGAGFCIALVVINPWLSDNTRLEVGTGWYNLGVIYEDQQRPFDAREAYRSALDANPDHVSALLNLGVLYARQNDLATSTGLFERALQLDPANETARRNLEINRSRMSTP